MSPSGTNPIEAMAEGAPPTPPGKTTLYLIRHAETADSLRGRFYGQMDASLSERGMRQSEATAARLSTVKFDAVYSSDLQRATILAELIAEPLDLPVRRLEVFRERNFGVLQGMTEEEIRERRPDVYREWTANRVMYEVEGGENFAQLQTRVMPAVRELIESFPGQRVALVCHGGPIRVTLADALGLPIERVFQFALDFACVSVIEYAVGAPPRIKLMNG